MNPIFYIIPFIPVAAVILIFMLDRKVIPRLIAKKAAKYFENGEYKKSISLVKAYLRKLKDGALINDFILLKLIFAIVAGNKEEQIDSLKKIKIDFYEKDFTYSYLISLVKIYCYGDKDVIASARTEFSNAVKAQFDNESLCALELLYFLEDDYESEEINSDDLLLLLSRTSDSFLKVVIYYLLFKTSKSDSNDEYLKVARKLSENTDHYDLLDNLIGVAAHNKAYKFYENGEYEKSISIINASMQHLKHADVINLLLALKLKYALLAYNVEEQLDSLAEINFSLFDEEGADLYLHSLIRVYCIGDKEVINSASLDFLHEMKEQFNTETQCAMQLLCFLKDEYEGKNVNTNDVLLLLGKTSQSFLKTVIYYLLYKTSHNKDGEEYLARTREFSKCTYDEFPETLKKIVKDTFIDRILDRLDEE